MSNDWYRVVDSTAELTQGDLIFECPLIGWGSDPLLTGKSIEKEVLKAATKAIAADVVVMTQACDLEQKKVRNVILCLHSSLEDYKKVWESTMRKRGQEPTTKSWNSHYEDIPDGFMWNLSILNSANCNGIIISPRVVDFHEVYSVPRPFLESLLRQRGEPRLQLLSPYREHLSQAFARFFMRIGLPTPVQA